MLADFIDAVLSTDLALHDGVVEKFEAIVAAGGVFAKDKAADQKVAHSQLPYRSVLAPLFSHVS